MTEITIPEGATLQEATRVSYDYTGASKTGPFVIPFPYFADTDITVYKDGVELTLTTDYSITGTPVDGGYSDGYVTLVVGITDNNLIITRTVPFERTSDFSASGPFPMTALNLTLDKMTTMLQQMRTYVLRAVRLDDSDPTEEVILPDVDTRKGKYLFFDATDGSPVVASATDLTSTAITPAGQALIEDASAADQRTTLSVYSQAEIDAELSAELKGRLIDVQVFTASGTWTKPADTKAIEVYCVGGGGGGGSATSGSATTYTYAAGGGGGGGAVAYGYFTSGIGATEPVTVGAGGTGGNAVDTSGTNGSDSQFGNTGGGGSIELVADGGKLGVFGSADSGNKIDYGDPGDGGLIVNCSSVGAAIAQYFQGDWGKTGICHIHNDGSNPVTGFSYRGIGGDTALGFGVAWKDDGTEHSLVTPFNVQGIVGLGYGSGGGGGARFYLNSTPTVTYQNGGNGKDGVVIVKSYA